MTAPPAIFPAPARTRGASPRSPAAARDPSLRSGSHLRLVAAFFFLSLLACTGAALGQARLAIDAGWEFRRAGPTAAAGEDAAWRPAQVPGSVHTDLLAAGRIPDPYVGAPEAGLQWIGLADWEYRVGFDVPEAMAAAPRNDLVFEGLDTFAEVFLNEEAILSADNAFRTWRLPVQGRLRAGTNTLRIVFRSPVATLLPKVQAMPHRIAGNYPSPYGDEPRDAMTANFVRKPGYHYGWDWGPRYVTAGVWKPVRLEAWDVLRIDDLQLRQDHVSAERAELTAIATLDVQRAGDFELRLWQTSPNGDRSQVARQRVDLATGTHVLSMPVEVAQPQRWFPVGYGPQPLYRYALEVVSERAVIAQADARTGLRSVELRRDVDATGRGFAFVINDVPVFAKGANAIPFDMFPARVDQAQLRRVLQSAVEANMNMIRNWGGGYYESDVFFDLADELGLLVWQDFMFGGGMQPAYDAAFRASVVAEARDQVRRLRNHPSIVLWCGNNEEEIAWKYWGHGRDLKAADAGFAAQVWAGYVQLFNHDLRAVVAEEAGGIGYVPSSPSDDMAEVANTPASGDMHYWEVWGNPARPPSAYLEITPRFMSEYGLQAWPVQRTVDHFAPRAEQRIDAPVIEAHQKFLAGKGNERLLHYVRMEYGEPADFADFIYLSQAMQAEGIGLAALHHRASRPYTMGSLYWQLNDVWPGASWSGIDWFGRWKALQFHARRFFAPVAVAALRKDGVTTVSLLSDRTTPRQGRLRTRVFALDGRLLHDADEAVELPPLSATVVARHADAELLQGTAPGAALAVFDLDVDGEPPARGVVQFAPAKELSWADPQLEAALHEADDGLRLTLAASRPARAVWIDFGALDAELEDNALTLLPGESVSVAVRSDVPAGALRAAMRVRSLADALGSVSRRAP